MPAPTARHLTLLAPCTLVGPQDVVTLLTLSRKQLDGFLNTLGTGLDKGAVLKALQAQPSLAVSSSSRGRGSGSGCSCKQVQDWTMG